MQIKPHGKQLQWRFSKFNSWCPKEDFSLAAQNIYNFQVGVGIQSKVAKSKYTHYKKMKFIEFKHNDGTFNKLPMKLE